MKEEYKERKNLLLFCVVFLSINIHTNDTVLFHHSFFSLALCSVQKFSLPFPVLTFIFIFFLSLFSQALSSQITLNIPRDQLRPLMDGDATQATSV